MTLDHDAIYKAYPNVRLIDDDKGAFDKDENKITIEQAKIDTARSELNTAYNAVKYQRDRAVAYPSIQEQLDLQYWDQVNSTTKWKDAIAKVKSDNPKP